MLSIIIPALNEERYIPFLLEGIRKQTFKDYEIIVADADSKDRTKEIAINSGCKVVRGGLPAKGRNEGAKVADGDLFLFIDADSIIQSERFLENLLMAFEKDSLGVASFPIYPDGNGLDRLLYWFYNLWVKLSQSFLSHATSAVLVKREVHDKIKGFDEEIRLAEDHDYARRAGKEEKFGFIEVKPIITSCRRLEREGRVKTYFKYVLAGIYTLLFGPVRSDIFNYRFDKSLKN